MSAERDTVTDDAILNGRLRLLQPRRGHRFGHDAVLLAAATPARPGQHVAEFGAGVGAAALALLARVPQIDITLVEIDPALTALAARNIARNGFSGSARAVTLDVTAGDDAFARAGLTAGAFDHVLMNPPFNDASLQASPDPARRSAHVAHDTTPTLWLRAAAHLLRPGGSVTLIWRADARDQVLDEVAARFGAIAVMPVRPMPDRAPIRILVHALKGAAQSLRTLPDIILAECDRRPSETAEAVLRDGGALAMTPD
jgi:tRNA1(Val) A37 N6-methylase TrmN6